MVFAKAAISSRVRGTVRVEGESRSERRGDLTSEPLHGSERRSRESVGSQGRHDDEHRAADGELAYHPADGAVE